MLTKTETESAATAARNWLAQFERALVEPNDGLLNTLFHTDSHWRDVLALSWRIKTVDGAEAIVGALKVDAGHARPKGFKIDPGRTAPRNVTRVGTPAVEAIFRFETAQGRGSGPQGAGQPRRRQGECAGLPLARRRQHRL